MRSSKVAGGRQYYHMSFIEHVELDKLVTGKVRYRQLDSLNRHKELQ